MKYFKVKNDILDVDFEGNPTRTDEPLWLRNEIDEWKERYGSDIGGGRFFATQDAKYSYIISPNEDLMDLSNDDLEELTEEEILEVIAVAFPEGYARYYLEDKLSAGLNLPNSTLYIYNNDTGDISFNSAITNTELNALSVYVTEMKDVADLFRVYEKSKDFVFNEFVPVPSLEKVCSVYWGYATNLTGNLSTQTLTVANNDYHIVGNITVLADQVITADPGVNIYSDGAYTWTHQAGTTGFTTIYAVGTPTARIKWELNARRLGTGAANSWNPFTTPPNNSVYNFQYCDFMSINNGFNAINSLTGFTLTFKHNYIEDIIGTFFVLGATFDMTIDLENILCYRVSTFLSINGPATGTGTINAKDIEFNFVRITFSSPSSGSFTFNLTDINANTNNLTQSIANGTVNCTRIIQNASYHVVGTCTFPATVYDSIAYGVNGTVFNVLTPTVVNVNIYNSDFSTSYISSGYALANYSGSTAVITATNCALFGTRGADMLNFFTGTETPTQIANTVTIVNGRKTRNFDFTATSITETALGNDTVTIGFNTSFRTNTKIRFGVTSGVYDRCVSDTKSWSDWDGKGQLSTTPSFVLTELLPATTYYYVIDVFDPVYNKCNTSAEGTFTTTGSVPVFGGLTGLETAGFGALQCKWDDATGVVSSYNIYARVGSTPTATDTYLVGKFDNGLNKKIFNYLRDDERIQDDEEVYVIAKAENSFGLDTNTVVYSLNPQGSGTVGVRTVNGVVVGIKGK